MKMQAIIEIDVDIDFGLARALRICSECGLKQVYSDSVKRLIRLAVLEDIKEKIECLSSIKGFFTIDLRLFIKICILENRALRTIDITPTPKHISKRVIGYTYVKNRLCIFEKTSQANTLMVRVLNVKTLPTILEPSMYLIRGTNNDIIAKVSEALDILTVLRNRMQTDIARICREEKT